MSVNKKAVQDTVNKVRSQASTEYQNSIPVLRNDNLASFKEAFFNYESATNEFYKGLVNLFAKLVWNTNVFNHDLSFLKKGTYSIGYDIEETHINPVNPAEYDITDTSGILGNYPAETMTTFYRENRHDVFPLTTNSEILSRAMDSWERLSQFISDTEKAVDNGNNLREFNLLKQAIVGMYQKSGFLTRTVDTSTDNGVASTMEQLRNDINDFKFISDKFNKYKELSGSNKSAKNSCPRENIVVICTTKAEARVRKYLSGVFNIQELEDANRFVLVDDFGYDVYSKNSNNARQLEITDHVTTPISFMICDKNLFQWYDKLQVKHTFENGYTLSINSFVHIWQLIAVSPFANAVVYIDKSAEKPASVEPTTETITNIGDSHEFEFKKTDNSTFVLNSLDELQITMNLGDTTGEKFVLLDYDEIKNCVSFEITSSGTLNVYYEKKFTKDMFEKTSDWTGLASGLINISSIQNQNASIVIIVSGLE